MKNLELQEYPGVFSVYCGDTSGLIKNVSDLYFEKNSKIADVTFGKGVFWKKVDQKNTKLLELI